MRFSKKQRGSGNGRGDQPIQAIVGQFAREAAIEDQRAGEREHNPQQAAGDLARGIALRIESETEEQQHHQRECERCVDGFLGAQLRAYVLVGDDQYQPEKFHHPSP
jgi:hypothetical protein